MLLEKADGTYTADSLPIYKGRCAGIRSSVAENTGPILSATFARALSQITSSRQVRLTDLSQKQRDPTDTSLRFISRSSGRKVRWGGD